jgi:hypothetical protein
MANPCVVAKSLSIEVLIETAREHVDKDVRPSFASISWRASLLLL